MADRDDYEWNNPALRENVDRRSPWRAGCRWLQSWWREAHLGVRCGTHKKGDTDGFVGSMLPESASPAANFLSEEAVVAVERRLGRKGGGGIVSKDRLYRNLLSSQPMCFNLFGHLEHHPDVLRDWLNLLGIDAAEVNPQVEIEWAPPKAEHFDGGSAFDAVITYRTPQGRSGFVGIECKYAENLGDQKTTSRPAYPEFTRNSGLWVTGATERLNTPETVQLWLNTLLAQSCVTKRVNDWDEGAVLMLACGADAGAFDATVQTASELNDAGWLRWSSYEALIDLAARRPELADWAQTFRARYLDFGPVADMLDEHDPRRSGSTRPILGDPESADRLRSSITTASAVGQRVFGEGSILGQIAGHVPESASALDVAVLAQRCETAQEEVRLLRSRAYPIWDKLHHDT